MRGCDLDNVYVAVIMLIHNADKAFEKNETIIEIDFERYYIRKKRCIAKDILLMSTQRKVASIILLQKNCYKICLHEFFVEIFCKNLLV